MIAFNKRRLFYLLGAALVVFWLVMVFLLVRKTHFQEERPSVGPVAEPKREPHLVHEWMEIYLKDKKVGFSESRVSPLGDDQLIEERMVLALNLMGQPSVVRMSTRAVLDDRYALKRFLMNIDSGVVQFRISGKVDENRVLVETGNGNKKRKTTIPVSGPLTIGAGLPGFFKAQPLKVGEEFRFTLFDPSVLSKRDVVVRVVDKTVISLNGKDYSAFRLETRVWGQRLVFWLSEKGLLLKEEGFMGLTLVRSDKARALSKMDDSTGADFYDMAAIPVNRTLDRPRDVNYLKVRLKGIQSSGFDLSALNGGRQTLTGDMLEIRRESIPQGTSNMSPNDGDSRLKRFLVPEINIQSDDSALVEKAREIAGYDKNQASVARKLTAWVYENVQKKPVVSVPDALAVLETRVGDCNEHAVLLTALLRAAGIPARECVGIVYTDHRFYYHAWTEAWLGRWITMDATLNQMPVDATHIKLVHGGLDKQSELMTLMGKLKLEVLDVTHD